jgi:ribonuclease P protein component
MSGARIGRLVHSTDFQRLLGTRPWSRSAHFAIHHVPGRPGDAAAPASGSGTDELSTDSVQNCPNTVDISGARHWLGCVLPKRLARRAVTRNLLRRQVRAAMERGRDSLPPGLWLVRLRAGFERAEFRSAASDALRRAARAELNAALAPR